MTDKLALYLSRGALAASCAVVGSILWRRRRPTEEWRGLAARCRVCDETSVYLAPELDAFCSWRDGVGTSRVTFACDDCGVANDAVLPLAVWEELVAHGATRSPDHVERMWNAVTFDEVHDVDVDDLVERLRTT